MRAAYVFPEIGNRANSLWLSEENFSTLTAMAHHLGLIVEDLGTETQDFGPALEDEGIWERYDDQEGYERWYADRISGNYPSF